MKLSLVLLAALAPQWALAQQIARVSLDRNSAAPSEQVKVTVEFDRAERIWCGLRVSFGDGDTRDMRVEQTPLTLVKQYATPGSYDVRVEGVTVIRGLKSAVACDGGPASARIDIIDPAVAREKEAREREAAERQRVLAEKERVLQDKEREIEAREQKLKEKRDVDAAEAQRAASRQQQASKPTVKTPPGPGPAPTPAPPAAPPASAPDKSRKVF